MSNICYLCTNQAESANHIFGLREYTDEARNLLKATHMQHISINVLQRNYAQAIDRTTRYQSTKETANYILFRIMKRMVQQNF
jgi:hypothetical protein